jgi:hypothetical protein
MFRRSLNLFLCPSTRRHTPDSSQASSHLAAQSLITLSLLVSLVALILLIYWVNGIGSYAYSLCSSRRISPARSPMMTQGAMVLPVVTRGMMEPSAIRRFWIPWTCSLPSTTAMESRPIFAVQV